MLPAGTANNLLDDEDNNNNEQEHGSVSKLTVATAPLTPPFHGEYEKAAPISTSTLSSAASLDANHRAVDDSMESGAQIESSCSSPYQAFLFSSEWIGSRELQLQFPDVISRSSSQVGTVQNDDADSVTSGAYFEPVDLDASNWMKAIRMDGPTVGFAMVALATAFVHPVLFVAGAITAVGTLHAVGAGYDFCNKGGKPDPEQTAESWENTILTICYKNAGDGPTLDSDKPQIEEQQQKAIANSLLLPELGPNGEAVSPQVPTGSCKIAEAEKDVEPSQAAASTPVHSEVKRPQRSKSLSKDLVAQAFPPLENKVVEGVTFPGLHAIEFFHVFFSDNCPYTFYELQKQRGDLDIVYGDWETLDSHEPVLLQGPKDIPLTSPQRLLENWKSSFQGRLLSFKAKTNNFLGPVYATTRKTQRVLLLHKTMVVMESRTDLSDIPFCDRFYVLERWIIRAEKVMDEKTGKHKYVSSLDATSQVVFTKSCQFASQIKTKSAATIQELISCWCAMANEALKLAEQRKILREQGEQSETDCYETDFEDDPVESNDQSKENTPPAQDEEGIEVAWPEKDLPPDNEKNGLGTRHKLRHSGSLPLPNYKGRGLRSIKRSVSNLWNSRR